MMRGKVSLRYVAALAAVMSLYVTRAVAQFQAPTVDELKMTADPKYPDAGAIFLNFENKTDNKVNYMSEYARIKILKESAKDLANIDLGYWKGVSSIAAIQGRTIHADGTIIPLTVKPDDLLFKKVGNEEVHRKVLSMPGVEVGSIIEYYYQVRLEEGWLSRPTWEVQKRYPVRKERFFFQPREGYLGNALLWYTNLPGGQKLQPDAAGRFEINMTDVPAVSGEKWAPPVDSRKYKVEFYFSTAMSSQQFWQSASRDWLKQVDNFAAASETLRQVAAGLISPGDGELDRAKKLYAAVQALDNTDYSRKKTEAERKREGLKLTKHAEDVWTQKSGDGQEIALVYLALLKAAHLTAYPMQVVDREQGSFNPDYLSTSQLDDFVVILSADGKEIVLDPAEKMCPFQMMSWKHAGAGGIRATAGGLEAWVTPLLPYSANVVVRRGELTVGPDGSVNGKLQFSMGGQEALRWRQQSLREDEEALKRNFDEWLRTQVPSGVEAHVNRFAKMDDPNSELGAYATVSGMPGTATSKRLLLPASFFAHSEDQGFIAQPDRQLPIDMRYAAVYKDGVLLHLPAGFALESAPVASAVPWTGFAVYQLKSMSSGNDLTMTRTLARAFTLLQPDDYSPMRDFYQKVNAADQQQIVLTNSATAKGN